MAEITAQDLLLQSAAIQSNPRLQAAAGNDEVTPMDTLTTPVEQPEKSVSDMANINPLSVGGQVFDEKWYKEQDSIRTESEDIAHIPGDGFISNTARQFMHGGNIAVNVGKELYRKTQAGPTDYSWNEEAVNTWLDQRKDKIAPEQRWRWFGTINNTEAEMLLADYTADNRAAQINSYRGGFENFAAGALAGLVDVDAPLTFLSGGLSAGAKLGINASRISRLLRGTVAGGITGLGMGQLDYMVNPNSDAESVALMGLMGAGFGLIGGGLEHARMQKGAIEDTAEQVIDGVQPPRDKVDVPSWKTSEPEPVEVPEGETRAPQAFDPDSLESDVLTGGTSSVGAQNLNPQYDGLGIRSVTGAAKQIILDAVQWKRQNAGMRDWDDPTGWMNAGYPEAAVRKAIRFRETIQKLGFGSDFDKLMRSNLATAQKLAMTLLESPSGIARQSTNAAVMKEAYFKEMQHTFRPYNDAFREYWAVERGGKWNKWLAEPWGTGSLQSKNLFNEEVIKELMSRKFGGQGTGSAAAMRAADSVEATFKKEYEIGKGMQGENPVQDYDQFNPEPGYVPQRWSGRKMADMIDEAGRTGGIPAANAMKQRMYRAMEDEYALQAPNWNVDYRNKAAQAVVDRALASRRGFQHDLIALLRGDEAEFIRDAMVRNNIPANEIDNVMLSITQSREQKTKLGQTQHRQSVDFRAVSTSGVRLMDMLETDMEILVGRRAINTSGMAALARMGISNKIEFEAIKDAILKEQEARGKRKARPTTDIRDKVDDFIDQEPEITPEYIDAIYSYFTGIRPNAGQGADAMVQRIKKVTQLSLMNQLGLTSLGEYGAVAGSVGWKRFVQHAGQDFSSMLSRVDSPLVQELKHFAVFEREEGLFNARLLHDLDKNQDSGMLSKLDAVLNKGVELQGVLSGFYAVRASQQRVAISSFTARLFEGFHGSADGFNSQRLTDVGIDQAFMNRVMKFAQFEPDGSLRRLNMDQWAPEDVQHYQRIAARATNQLVQKAMAGESNWAFHNSGIAQLFFQLKSFPLLAVNKQFVRNTRMTDKQALTTFFHGLVLSGAAYAAKEVVNGRSEDLTAERIARGALNYSNMTGWMPMFVDPVLGMAGADGSLSGYSSHGAGSVLALPAALTVGDRLLQLPGAAAKLLLSPTGLTDFKNSDIRILQSIPLLGNAYGINGILNNMKD